MTERAKTLEKRQEGEAGMKELGEESEKPKKRTLRERWKGLRPSKGAEKSSETAGTTAEEETKSSETAGTIAVEETTKDDAKTQRRYVARCKSGIDFTIDCFATMGKVIMLLASSVSSPVFLSLRHTTDVTEGMSTVQDRLRSFPVHIQAVAEL
ncbi:hypothetical protein IMZ48_05835 [Candidatus Bathyarchaeota archaeon]|nr:hypothetical protein [Candidatus Bathyarchaeota archaeon]